jgi:hypothetical protein
VTTGQQRAAWTLLLAGALLVVVARLVNPSAPALYDSFSNPDPYRYLHPSSGQRDQPASATVTTLYTGQDPGPLVLATSENPPQAQLLVGADTLNVPAGAHSITTTITPVDTPQPPPRDGVVVGNTYRYRMVTDSGAEVTLRPDHPVSVVLRGPAGTTQASIDLFSGGTWTRLATTPVGGPDIFAANTTQLGDVALVAPAPAPQPAPSTDRSWVVWVVSAVVAAIIVLASAWSLRRRRR